MVEDLDIQTLREFVRSIDLADLGEADIAMDDTDYESEEEKHPSGLSEEEKRMRQRKYEQRHYKKKVNEMNELSKQVVAYGWKILGQLREVCRFQLSDDNDTSEPSEVVRKYIPVTRVYLSTWVQSKENRFLKKQQSVLNHIGDEIIQLLTNRGLQIN